MANPQPTESHLRISHRIAEELIRRNFSKPQLNIIFYVLRLSWGCGQPSAFIPNSADFKVCGVGQGHVADYLRQLEDSKVLIIDEPFYQVQKDFDQWQISATSGWNKKRYDELVSENIRMKAPDLRGTCHSPLRGDIPLDGEEFPSQGNSPPSSGTAPLPQNGKSSPPRGMGCGEKPDSTWPRKVPIKRRSLITRKTSNNQQPPVRANDRTIYQIFEGEFGRPLSPIENEMITNWIEKDKFDPDLIKRGLEESVKYGALNFMYLDRILLSWRKKGWQTRAQVDSGQKAGQERRNNSGHKPKLHVLQGGTKSQSQLPDPDQAGKYDAFYQLYSGREEVATSEGEPNLGGQATILTEEEAHRFRAGIVWRKVLSALRDHLDPDSLQEVIESFEPVSENDRGQLTLQVPSDRLTTYHQAILDAYGPIAGAPHPSAVRVHINVSTKAEVLRNA